jgi:putative transposase
MANTYTQIHIQTVFAVKFREALITPELKPQLFGYIGETIKSYGHKLLIVNGVHDHVHCFFGMRPTQSISDLMQEVKSNSSKWINDNRLLSSKFAWQEGFGAFSYAKSQCSNVITYIENQEIHHQKRTFREEYMDMLEKAEIDYDERYIFSDLI